MTYAIGIGALLFVGAGLWFINTQEAEAVETEAEVATKHPEKDKLQKAMDSGGLNNPRNDIHVDSLTSKIPASYASVDPQRHKMPSKNPKDFEGDAVWVTALGDAVETSNLHKEEQLIGSVNETRDFSFLNPDKLDSSEQLKVPPPVGWHPGLNN